MLYEYRCQDCETHDHRIAGIDDHMALCVDCGGLMIRLDDPFDEELRAVGYYPGSVSDPRD